MLNEKKSTGFTIIETLVAITVMAGLAALATPFIFGTLEKTQIAQEKAILASMRIDIEKSFLSEDLSTNLSYVMQSAGFVASPFNNTSGVSLNETLTSMISSSFTLPLGSYTSSQELDVDGNPTGNTLYDMRGVLGPDNFTSISGDTLSQKMDTAIAVYDTAIKMNGATNYVRLLNNYVYIGAVNDWRYKLGAIRRVAPVTGYVSQSMAGFGSMIFNARGYARILLAAQPNNSNTQRYLLISYMGPVDVAPFFPNSTTAYSTVFNEIWNYPWGELQATRPSKVHSSGRNYWDGWVNPTSGSGGNNGRAYAYKTNDFDFSWYSAQGIRSLFPFETLTAQSRTLGSYLLVERIEQHKFPVFITHNAPNSFISVQVGNAMILTDRAYNTTDSASNNINLSTLTPAESVQQIGQLAQGVLAGRKLTVYRSETAGGSKTVVYQTIISGPVSLTVQ